MLAYVEVEFCEVQLVVGCGSCEQGSRIGPESPNGSPLSTFPMAEHVQREADGAQDVGDKGIRAKPVGPLRMVARSTGVGT